jgi:hypothetical protein
VSQFHGGGGNVFSRRVINAVVFPAEGCSGTWSIAEESHSGPIVGGDVFSYGHGRPAPRGVRVLGGTAYTVNSLEDTWGGGLIAVLFLAGGVYLLVRRPRR